MSATPDLLTPRDSTPTGVFADAAGSRLQRVVRRDVLVRTLAALETAADDAMSSGPSESDADYLAAIAEARAELEAPNVELADETTRRSP